MVLQVQTELMVQLEQPEHKALRVQLGQPVHKAQPAQQAQLDLPVLMVHKDLLVQTVYKDLPEHKDPLEQMEQAWLLAMFVSLQITMA